MIYIALTVLLIVFLIISGFRSVIPYQRLFNGGYGRFFKPEREYGGYNSSLPR